MLKSQIESGAYRSSLRVMVLLLLFTQSAPDAQDVVAQHAMVASAHPTASQIGIDILKCGGNAADAAVAMALALGVVEPNASGLGGGGFFVYRAAAEKCAMMIDYRESAPRGIDPGAFYRHPAAFDSLTRSGIDAIGVPGTAAGLYLAWKKAGRLPWRQLVEPARRLAAEGQIVDQVLARRILEEYQLLSADSVAASVFIPDGFLPAEEGSVVRNPMLAEALGNLGEEGPDWFYKNAGARSLADFMRGHRGPMNRRDLERYEAKSRPVVQKKYRGYTLITSAPPAAGAYLIELLQILEGYDLAAMPHNSAAYLHLLAEAMKRVLAHRAETLADPDFFTVPLDRITDPARSAALRRTIRVDSASVDVEEIVTGLDDPGSTTHLSVVDEAGNMASLTQSINTWFGSGLMEPETGILLNNHLGDFDKRPGRPNSVAPDKRPASYATPTLVLNQGRPFITIGTPGGERIITAVAQILINIIDFGMEIDEAIEAPRIHPSGGRLYMERRIPAEVAKSLTEMGHVVEYKAEFDAYFGGAQGILVDPASGELHGGADSRRAGTAMGY